MTKRTSLTWWEHMLTTPAAFTAWLQDQYHGEVTAAVRIRTFASTFASNKQHQAILEVIAGQEELHAQWVAELLVARGVTPKVLDKVERYWDKALPGIADFVTGAAVASHAERMRLERIRVICQHSDSPDDVRLVFQKILPQEEFHERAFAQMAGAEALAATVDAHEQGLEALGLVM
jgi:rubrerythrin